MRRSHKDKRDRSPAPKPPRLVPRVRIIPLSEALKLPEEPSPSSRPAASHTGE
jgi:hypothetical protein